MAELGRVGRRPRRLMSESRDDLDLVEACRAGRTEAFNALVLRYQDRLYNVLLRLSDSAEDARDLVQVAFMRAFERIDRFEGESGFFTWLYRIGVNLAISERRRRKVPGRSASSLSSHVPEPADDLESSDPSRKLILDEQERLVQQALNELPPAYRIVIAMNHLDEMSYEEIARVLEIPVGTVRSRLHRARSKLHDLLRVALDDRPRPATEPSPAKPTVG